MRHFHIPEDAVLDDVDAPPVWSGVRSCCTTAATGPERIRAARPDNRAGKVQGDNGWNQIADAKGGISGMSGLVMSGRRSRKLLHISFALLNAVRVYAATSQSGKPLMKVIQAA